MHPIFFFSISPLRAPHAQGTTGKPPASKYIVRYDMCVGTMQLKANLPSLQIAIRFTARTRRKHEEKKQTQSLESSIWDTKFSHENACKASNISMNWKSRLGLIDTTYPTLRNQLAIGADFGSHQTTRTASDMGTSQYRNRSSTTTSEHIQA